MGRRARFGRLPAATATRPSRARPAAFAGAASFLLVLLLLPSTVSAQGRDSLDSRIERSQRRLEQIRERREELEARMGRLQDRAHAVAAEIHNLEERIRQSASALGEIRAQLSAVEERVRRSTRELLRTRDRLTAARVELRERLEEVYKRGSLDPVRVLLGADSFAELLNRYKYLRLITTHDRILVSQVQELERRLAEYREQLATQRDWLERLRGERGGELAELRRLEAERRRRLETVRDRQSRAESRISRLAREEEELRSLLSELERARREAERAGAGTESTLRTSELGDLDWPVRGEVVYGFGRERRNGSTVMREGIGIAAEPGTPVRAVEAGEVVWAGSRGLYGPSVIVSHGGGYYSLYLYLRDLRVAEGDRVEADQVVGEVGGVGSPAGPHVEFQIREPSPSGGPRAVDPVKWLRGRR